MSLTIARTTVTTWRSLPRDVWLLVDGPGRQPAGRLHLALPGGDPGGGGGSDGGPGGVPDGGLRAGDHPVAAAGRAVGRRVGHPLHDRGRPGRDGHGPARRGRLVLADPGDRGGGAPRAGVRGLRSAQPGARRRRHAGRGPAGRVRPAVRRPGRGRDGRRSGGRPARRRRAALALRGRRGDLPGLRGGGVARPAHPGAGARPGVGATSEPLARPAPARPARSRDGVRGGVPPGHHHPAPHGDRARPLHRGGRAAAHGVGRDDRGGAAGAVTAVAAPARRPVGDGRRATSCSPPDCWRRAW